MANLSCFFTLSCLSILFVAGQCGPNIENKSDIPKKYSNCKYYEVGKPIKNIDAAALSSIGNLTVECSNKTIDYTFFDDFPKVWSANLSDNRMDLSFLSKNKSVANLETLILDRNFRGKPVNDRSRLLVLATIFPNLRRLCIRGNQIFIVSPGYLPLNKIMPRLAHLDLSNNGITNVQALLEFMPSTLTHLILDKNNIINFSGMPLKNLEELSLNENDIFILGYFRNVAVESPCVALKGASSLKKLSVSGRGNSHLVIEDDAMTDLKNLVELNLSGYSRTIVDDDTFNSLKKLKTLKLQSSNLRKIPNFSALKTLVKLDVSGNNIRISSSKCIAPTENMRVLNITNNPFRCDDKSLATYCQDSRGVCVLSGCQTDSSKNCLNAGKLISSSSSRS